MQERIRPQKSEKTDSDSQENVIPVQASDSVSRLKDDLDDLLDEIDEVLESNAEEFVKNYVQKGGE